MRITLFKGATRDLPLPWDGNCSLYFKCIQIFCVRGSASMAVVEGGQMLDQRECPPPPWQRLASRWPRPKPVSETVSSQAAIARCGQANGSWKGSGGQKRGHLEKGALI